MNYLKFLKYLEKGIEFNIHNYFSSKNFVLNIASDKDQVKESCKNLISSTLDLCKISNSKVYAIHAGYLSNARSIKKAVI